MFSATQEMAGSTPQRTSVYWILVMTLVLLPSLVMSKSLTVRQGNKCPDPSTPQDGKVNLTYDWMRNRMAVFTCNPGYTMIGSGLLLCGGNGWNDSEPVCAIQDCQAHYEAGSKTDGMYGITPDGTTQRMVYCDMTTAGGGWTVFQRRVDNFTDFSRDWQSYKHGFGEVQGNFWLGLEALHHLTRSDSEIYIHMKADQNDAKVAQYGMFRVGGERDNYRLRVGIYSGNAGDSLAYHSGFMFSTMDNDNDISKDTHCAKVRRAAWWYGGCDQSNLNGLYLNGQYKGMGDMGIVWDKYKGGQFSLKYVKMMMRRKQG